MQGFLYLISASLGKNVNGERNLCPTRCLSLSRPDVPSQLLGCVSPLSFQPHFFPFSLSLLTGGGGRERLGLDQAMEVRVLASDYDFLAFWGFALYLRSPPPHPSPPLSGRSLNFMQKFRTEV